MQTLLDWLATHLRLLGVAAIALSVLTWWMDLADLVHHCVYCRTQRTAIGIVGLLMLLPDPRSWWIRWPATAIAFVGAHVSGAQLFLIIRSIDEGEPFGALNLFMASGAMLALTGQVMLLFMRPDALPHNAGGD